MSLLVFLHVTWVTETFSTVTAAKRLLPRVVAQMHRQVARLAEALPAHWAAVWLLPCVDPVVFLVVTCMPEGATAEGAAVLFSDVPLDFLRAWTICDNVCLLFSGSSNVCIIVSFRQRLFNAMLVQDNSWLNVRSWISLKRFKVSPGIIIKIIWSLHSVFICCGLYFHFILFWNCIFSYGVCKVWNLWWKSITILFFNGYRFV